MKKKSIVGIKICRHVSERVREYLCAHESVNFLWPFGSDHQHNFFSTCPIMHWALALAAFVLHSSIYVLVELLSFAKKVNKGRKKKCTSIFLPSFACIVSLLCATCALPSSALGELNVQVTITASECERHVEEEKTWPLFTLFCLIGHFLHFSVSFLNEQTIKAGINFNINLNNLITENKGPS